MRFKVSLVALIASAVSCNGAQVKSLEDKVAALEAANADLKRTTDTMRFSIEALQDDKLFRDLGDVAYLTPGSDGYATLQTDVGRLTVSLENIQPYANGTRVTLRFGNLTSARINGLKAKVEWGPVDEKGTPKNEVARSREVSLTQSLDAGAWTNSQVVLEAVPPTELGFVRLREVSNTGIGLRR